MTPRIEVLKEKKLAGKFLKMSFDEYPVAKLWKKFMPVRREIPNTISSDLISMTVYQPNHFADFKPTNEFVKWAAVEVTDFENVPENFQVFTIVPGLYAVFDYKGSSTDHAIFEYIFGTWLPSSDYALDDRPHFEILGDKYKTNDPASEEEIWIPVKKKKLK